VVAGEPRQVGGGLRGPPIDSIRLWKGQDVARFVGSTDTPERWFRGSILFRTLITIDG